MRMTVRTVAASAALWSCGLMGAVAAEPETETEMSAFEALRDGKWETTFRDPGTANWEQNWQLDGRNATIRNTASGMEFAAGPEAGDDAHHAVLWTRRSFSGDVRIDYEYTRLDQAARYVTILYIQATGSGVSPFTHDVLDWAHLRAVPSMSLYFKNMNTYHISYAAFDVRNNDPLDDYIRARRYQPDQGRGLRGTDLEPDYLRTGLFEPNVPHQITVIKTGTDLWMHIRNPERSLLCRWPTETAPPITEGRIGLRHMYTRAARYREFVVSTRPAEQE